MKKPLAALLCACLLLVSFEPSAWAETVRLARVPKPAAARAVPALRAVLPAAGLLPRAAAPAAAEPSALQSLRGAQPPPSPAAGDLNAPLFDGSMARKWAAAAALGAALALPAGPGTAQPAPSARSAAVLQPQAALAVRGAAQLSRADVEVGAPARLKIRLENPGGQPVAVPVSGLAGALAATSPFFSVEPIERSVTIPPNGSAWVEFELTLRELPAELLPGGSARLAVGPAWYARGSARYELPRVELLVRSSLTADADPRPETLEPWPLKSVDPWLAAAWTAALAAAGAGALAWLRRRGRPVQAPGGAAAVPSARDPRVAMGELAKLAGDKSVPDRDFYELLADLLLEGLERKHGLGRWPSATMLERAGALRGRLSPDEERSLRALLRRALPAVYGKQPMPVRQRRLDVVKAAALIGLALEPPAATRGRGGGAAAALALAILAAGAAGTGTPNPAEAQPTKGAVQIEPVGYPAALLFTQHERLALGNAYFKAGRYGEAGSIYAQTAAQEPDLAEAHLFSALARVKQGLPAAAEARSAADAAAASGSASLLIAARLVQADEEARAGRVASAAALYRSALRLRADEDRAVEAQKLSRRNYERLLRAAGPSQPPTVFAPVETTLTAQIRLEPPSVRIGEPARLLVTVANPHDVPARVPLRRLGAEIEKASQVLAATSALGHDPVLPPGAEATFVVELNLRRLPAGLDPGKKIPVAVAPARAREGRAALSTPGFTLEVASSFAPGEPPQVADVKPWRVSELSLWLSALWGAAGAALTAGAARWWLRRRSRSPTAPAASTLPADPYSAAADRLDAGAGPAAVYGSIADAALADAGAPTEGTWRERLAASEAGIRPERAAALRALIDKAEAAAFGGVTFEASEIRADLEAARAASRPAGAGGRAAAALAAGAAAAAASTSAQAAEAGAAFAVGPVSFADPLWLIGLIPVAVLLSWSLKRRNAAAFEAPTADWTAAGPSLRQRLFWVPKALRALALALVFVAMANPMWGHLASMRPSASLDTMLVIDRSGSMRHDVDRHGHIVPGSNNRKIEKAQKAGKEFAALQRGTRNRVGVVAFDSSASLVMPLNRDVQAVQRAIDRIDVRGGTHIGAAIDAALAHMLETALIESRHPSAGEVRDALKYHGSQAALDLARRQPGLLESVQDKDRPRVMVLLTDGASQDDVLEPARRAKAMGVIVHAISIPEGDPKQLQAVADISGGRYFQVDDADMLDRIFEEVDRLQKQLLREPAPPKLVPRDAHLMAAAAIATALSLLPASWAFLILSLLSHVLPARLRRDAAARIVAAAMIAPLLAAQAPDARAQHAPRQVPPEARPRAGDWLPYREIPAAREGNAWLEAGRPKEALEAYARAQQANPDAPELSYYRSLAEKALGDDAAARRSLQRAAEHARRAGDAELEAVARLGAGTLAAKSGDAKAALKSFEDAQRVEGPASGRLAQLRELAKRNYEAVLRAQGGGGGGQDGEGGESGEDEKRGQGGKKPGDGQKGDAGDKPGKAEGQGRESGGATRGGGRKPMGQAWSVAPVPLMLDTGWVEGLRQQLVALAGGQPGDPLLWHNPEYLWLTLPVVAVGALGAWRAAKRAKKAADLLEPSAVSKSLWSWAPARAVLRRAALGLTAAAFFIAAAAGPYVPTREEAPGFGDQDVVVLHDVSWSVLWAVDGRREASAQGLDALVETLTRAGATDRLALVPFAGSVTAGALSRDLQSARFGVYRLDADAEALDEGSDVVAAGRHAARLFEEAAKTESKRGRVLIVATDGGDHKAEDLRALGAELARKGIKVHVLALGSGAHVEMKVPDRYVDRVGAPYLKERSGAVAKTGLNEEALRALAEAGGGRYYRVAAKGDAEQALHDIADHERRVSAQPKAELSAARWIGLPGAAFLALAFLGGGAFQRRRPEAEDSEAALESLALRSRALTFSRVLKGRFTSPEKAKSGFDIVDAVPYTDEPARDVDHGATARAGGQVHARRYEGEPDIPVLVVADLSSQAAPGGRSKARAAAEAGAALALAAVREDMPASVLAAHGAVDGGRPRKAASHARQVAAELLAGAAGGRGPSLSTALEDALGLMRRRGVVVVLSDFAQPGYEEALAALASRHVVLPVLLEHAAERRPPAGVGLVPLEDARSGASAVLDTDSPEALAEVGRAREARLVAVREALGAAGSRVFTLDTSPDSLDSLASQLRTGGKTDDE